MTEDLRDKLSKVYNLANQGTTEGERAAAKKALDRMIDKYNIDPAELENLSLKTYIFKYSTVLEYRLLAAIMNMFLENGTKTSRRTNWHNGKAVKQVVSQLTYLDWITIESAYEYFRRHMKSEWNRLCIPEISKCRKAKTKKARREELEPLFYTQYIIASKLHNPADIVKVPIEDIPPAELANLQKIADIKGGEYNRQLTNGLLLTN